MSSKASHIFNHLHRKIDFSRGKVYFETQLFCDQDFPYANYVGGGSHFRQKNRSMF